MTFHFDAGRYAPFLWSAYGLSALTILALVADSLWRARRWRMAGEPQDGAQAQGEPDL